MGRPKRAVPASRPIHVTTTPKMLTYLDAIVIAESHGNSRAEVARRFIWDGINGLITRGLIDRISEAQ